MWQLLHIIFIKEIVTLKAKQGEFQMEGFADNLRIFTATLSQTFILKVRKLGFIICWLTE